MSEQRESLARDPFGGRRPTSHERMTGQPWDASYDDGPAPWDIGRPQPVIARLVSDGRIVGPVLDAGCGSGETRFTLRRSACRFSASTSPKRRSRSHARRPPSAESTSNSQLPTRSS
jgi:hypothetical protein